MDGSLQYIQRICSAVNPPVTADELTCILSRYTENDILLILDKYGIGMLGNLFLLSAYKLPATFSQNVTKSDGNCFIYSLQDNARLNQGLRQNPSQLQTLMQTLGKSVEEIRKLWCEIGRHMFAGL